MKRIVCAILALAIAAPAAFADEGMWLLPLLEKMNGKALSAAGCHLTPEQIYSLNGTSLKDAIVQFGGGCTAEIVSDEGLVLTNHHCGYYSIQKLSSVEHDYLKDGYWAMRRSEELPCPGLTVTFLESMTDVTAAIEKVAQKARKACKDPEKVEEAVAAAVEEAMAAFVEGVENAKPGCSAEVESFFNDNMYCLVVYKVYKDVRFVGAPPSSIGKFGADTDNWIWPRHTCDFSMFRVYAGPDNEPAEYSEANVPLKPKNHLSISLKGINEGDYTMIMGFPGRTTRFQTSPELENQIAVNDVRIAARTVRQNVMMEHMLADPAVNIQYASKYSSSSNGWKKWQGMKLAFGKLDIIGRAREEEAAFDKWVSKCPARKKKYGSAIEDLRVKAESVREPNTDFILAYETIYQIELTRSATMLNNAFRRNLKEGADSAAAMKAALESVEPRYKDYNAALDLDVTKAMLKFYRDNASAANYPVIEGEDFATMDIDAFADRLFSESSFTSFESLEAALAGGAGVTDDPAYKVGHALVTSLMPLQNKFLSAQDGFAPLRRNYTAGLLEWKKDEPSYPDANFTMRLTYGHVLPYSPKDAVIYRHFTTLDGVMEKEDPDNWEFVVPAKLKELWKAKDFGQYAMADGRMPACFLSNNDITGGNSGSPIMNADGQLLGLAFDGNWESMSSDVMFEPELQRCINVDIRYVLFIIDKFGGAGWLLDEMTLVK